MGTVCNWKVCNGWSEEKMSSPEQPLRQETSKRSNFSTGIHHYVIQHLSWVTNASQSNDEWSFGRGKALYSEIPWAAGWERTQINFQTSWRESERERERVNEEYNFSINFCRNEKHWLCQTKCHMQEPHARVSAAFVCLSVSNLTLNLMCNFDEICREGQKWHRDQSFRFWE